METTTFDQGWGDADKPRYRRSVNPIPPQGRAVRITQPQQHGVRQQHRSGSNSQGAPSRGRQGRQGLGRIGRRTSSRASGRGANRPSRTIGERALRTEPNAHQGNAEVVGEHQRSYHRQLCLQTRSPLPSSTPPKRTTRVTRTDTATLTPTRRRFQQLRKTKAQDKPEMDPDLEPEVQPEQPSTPAELIDAVPTSTD